MPVEKIIAPEALSSFCENLRKQGARIVFTNGVFDLLHPGHVQYLAAARNYGTHLIVALNSDDSARRLKGKERPLVPLAQRMEVLAALTAVSVVTWFEEDTPLKVIQTARPDVLMKGGDWKVDDIVGKDFVESYGGKVETIPYLSGSSTTNIVERILKS
jgi:rfaE bifunctional protein nucleotidyltransferase chain/domain